MSLFGALFTGVSGLGAQSQATAMISNNIANVNTVGFKRSEASFFSLVTTESRSSLYSPGTVGVNRIQRVDQQGPIQQTASATDVAISGNGFFPVKRDALAGQEFLYTRSGSFSEDSQGLLRNSANFVLYGWPIDTNGNLPANQGDLSSLVPIDVAFLGGLTRPTSSGMMSLNLNADQPSYNPQILGESYPISNSQPPHFTRGLTVYDSLGSAQVLTYELRKVTGPMAQATSNTNGLNLNTPLVSSIMPNIADGNEFEITVGGTTETVRIVSGTPTVPAVGADVEVQTIQDLISYINNQFAGGGVLSGRLDSAGRFQILGRELTTDFTLEDTVGTALFNNDGFGMPGTGPAATYQHTDITSTYSGNDQSVLPEPEFPAFQNSTNPNPYGWWEMRVIHPDGSTLTEGLLNFNGDGTLNANADVNGDIDIQLTNINWGNGSDLQSISLDIERFSQFAGNYDVISSDQNGAELGLRTGVEITREGFVVARFSNGASTRLYKIPMVTFANANGLNEVSGTAYSKTEDSGEENLREAGRGGSGFLESGTIEGSNVDLADEFAKLIVGQRAYSANTRIINTVDQMTEELLRLR